MPGHQLLHDRERIFECVLRVVESVTLLEDVAETNVSDSHLPAATDTHRVEYGQTRGDTQRFAKARLRLCQFSLCHADGAQAVVNHHEIALPFEVGWID